MFRDNGFHSGDNIRRQFAELLVRSHHREIFVRLNRKEVEHLPDHLAMLTRRADDDRQIGGRLQPPDQWRHLDRLGTRADDSEDRWHGILLSGQICADRRNALSA